MRNASLWKKRLVAIGFLATLLVAPLAAAQVIIQIPNPIQATSFADLVKEIAQGIRTIGIALAVIAIVWAGFQFLVGSISSDTGKLTKARTILLYALVGTAVVVAATALAEAIVNFAQNL